MVESALSARIRLGAITLEALMHCLQTGVYSSYRRQSIFQHGGQLDQEMEVNCKATLIRELNRDRRLEHFTVSERSDRNV
jgi:hypothetical protein